MCECGCGEKTNLAPKSDKRAGWVKGKPLRFKRGHQTKGRSLKRLELTPVKIRYVLSVKRLDLLMSLVNALIREMVGRVGVVIVNVALLEIIL